MVVFIRPTLASRQIFAKSIPNSGTSTIFSRSTFEQRGEAMIAKEYNSQKVNFLDIREAGPSWDWLVKTAFVSLKIACRRSY